LNNTTGGLCPAVTFDTPAAAAEAVGVIYADSQNHLWQLRDTDALSDGRLSDWAG
jgi:acyl-homoserine lactone acylase PvdQ